MLIDDVSIIRTKLKVKEYFLLMIKKQKKTKKNKKYSSSSSLSLQFQSCVSF